MKTISVSDSKPVLKKDVRFEYIRAIATIMVVAIHSLNSAVILFESGDVSKCIYNSAKNLMWFAVPCFMMLTGLLLNSPNKNISIKALYKKYVFKISVVLLVFGLGFAWLELVFVDKTINFQHPFIAFWNMMKGETWAHLWYLYCLLGIYFLFPLWNIVSKKASDNEFKYILLILLIFGSVLNVLKLFGVKLGFNNHITNIYPFWFLLGAGYHRGFLDIPKKKAVLLFSVCSGLLLAVTWVDAFGSFENINWNILFGYDSILVVGQSIGLFALLMNIKPKKYLKNVLLELADKSFGIYLIHMVFINFEYKFLVINPFRYGIYSEILLIIANIVLSYCVVWVLKKIPVVRKFI